MKDSEEELLLKVNSFLEGHVDEISGSVLDSGLFSESERKLCLIWYQCVEAVIDAKRTESVDMLKRVALEALE